MKPVSGGKHVCLVIRGLGGRSGGAERIYCELANILSENGYRITCLYYDTIDKEPFYHINSTVERLNLYGPPRRAVKCREFLSQYLGKSAREKAEWDVKNDFFIRQLSDYFTLVKPDVAISVLPPANTPALLAAVGTKVKVIPTNHNVPEQDYLNPLRWSPNQVDRALRLKVLDNAAAIHVLFPEFGKWFPHHLQSKIVAIPNYISPEFIRPVSVEQRENVVLAVGRLAEVKNYLQLVRAWAQIADRHPDWKVRIYGSGPQRNVLKKEIGSLGLQGRIELPGQKTDLAEDYARASIFCHPAHFEGFGLSAAEALFMGTPVVAFADCAGINQFVKDRFNGLAVDRQNPTDQLAVALDKLIADPVLRQTLGANGPQSVRDFTIERYTDAWLKLLARVTETD